MSSRSIPLVLAAALTLCGCESAEKKAEKKRQEGNRDFSAEPGFQAFLGRLYTAVKNKDHAMIGSMMTPDFGYRWDDPPPGDNVFTYWDMNNIWPEVEQILRTKFVPFRAEGGSMYMVAPPEMASDPNYAGYRAGMRLVTGSWKFAYFVPPQPGGQAQ
jgi:hypothetical protein